MSDPMSKLCAIFLVLGVWLGLTGLILVTVDQCTNFYIQDETTVFVDECRTTGRIDEQNYKKYCKKIFRMGNYKVELSHKSRLAFEDGEDNFRTDYLEKSTEQILEVMFPVDGEEKDYKMNNEDFLTITIKKTTGSFTDKLMGIITRINVKGQTVVHYGGIVGYYGE